MIRNKYERVAKIELENNGWKVLNSGFPDFFCYKEAQKEFKFLEVKSPDDDLSNAQKKLHLIFRLFQIPVEIRKFGTIERMKHKRVGARLKPIRDEEILKSRIRGMTLQEIGDGFGLTRERVRQIINKQLSKDKKGRAKPAKREK